AGPPQLQAIDLRECVDNLAPYRTIAVAGNRGDESEVVRRNEPPRFQQRPAVSEQVYPILRLHLLDHLCEGRKCRRDVLNAVVAIVPDFQLERRTALSR